MVLDSYVERLFNPRLKATPGSESLRNNHFGKAEPPGE